ncbi:uncharacterized protein LACBIDRAFT_303539 [Laccaria bicolor S238N-H82]|uniref:Predicted protein n=1 Tax=Laccaria bicolor (strain S238N-H82 / ATCC MYA-4686) TaxID=486041 RepID=B0DJN5_LACBS|nr:uncharacterized protein LACBIDRAFT_303539 [Laccaria bicolor S238N-H82]EDR05240.1 predicted protein [Laccaria bicolor S238N-H82]|eukprot:XP_001884205.1 predicted protein [Laccaria bicolor S238N-H82]
MHMFKTYDLGFRFQYSSSHWLPKDTVSETRNGSGAFMIIHPHPPIATVPQHTTSHLEDSVPIPT